MNLRFIDTNNKVYIRKEDVCAYISEIAATEDTDTKNRLVEAVSYLDKIGIREK